LGAPGSFPASGLAGNIVPANPILLAGVEQRPGDVVSCTVAHPAGVTDKLVSAGDVVATLLTAVGLDRGELRAHQGPPFAASDGRTIERVVRGE
jgi:hypothetical protein